MTVVMRLPILFAACAVCVSSVAAVAKPPPGPIDPAVHAWFESLVRADGTHCCGVADCRIASPNEVRVGANGFEVYLNGVWQSVPESMMVRRENGPFAATIICKTHSEDELTPDKLYCVVPYAGG